MKSKLRHFSIIGSLFAICFIVAGITQFLAYAQSVDNGVIGQVIGDSRVEFYVKNVEASISSGVKEVDVSIVFKNIGHSPQLLHPNGVRLVDSQSREYQPEYSLFQVSSIYLPPDDTLTWVASFKVLPTNNFSKIYFTPDQSSTRFTIDLTKTMNPKDDPPTSSWVLASNKDLKMSNRQVEITVNDERYDGNTYLIDITIKNIGSSPTSVSQSDFNVKDADGYAYSYTFLYDLLSPLLQGQLPPGEMVRGDIAFDVQKSGGNMMILFSGLYGGTLLNTGKAPIQNASNFKPSNDTSVSIVLGSSSPSNGVYYDPDSVSISKGTTIVWTNEDSVLHTVTSGRPEDGNAGLEFDSSYLASDRTYEHSFQDFGTFDYYCTLHPFMTGTVIVK